MSKHPFVGLAASLCLLMLTGLDARADSRSVSPPARQNDAKPILAPVAHQIAASGYALAPLGHVRFCLENPGECRIQRRSLRRGGISARPERLAELAEVNARINRQIRPKEDAPGVMNDIWSIAPRAGDCDDYAVTKRAALLRSGWPSRSLLLATAWLPDGQSHLVLIARTSGGDFVLDNLVRDVLPVTRAALSWNAIQDETNPRYWRRVRSGQSLMAFVPQLQSLVAESRMAALRPEKAAKEVRQIAANWPLRLVADAATP